MSMFTLRRSQKQSGFTLMELLIVIAVLGLLLGMLIPRLAGVTDDTVDTVCDSNNKGIRYYAQAYYNKTSSMPNGLTNLVDLSVDEAAVTANDGLGSANLPLFENPDNDEAEALAEEFYTRNFPGYYVLSAAEVKELRALGITKVYQFANADGRSMASYSITSDETDFGVMMMGAEADSYSGNPSLTFEDDDAIGNPFWVGRIMMAVNDQCDLVKKGYIQASALCPGAVLAEENFTIKEYIFVLPRLQATVERFESANLYVDGEDMLFIDAESESAVDDDSYRIIEDTFAAQETWEFDMSCPEGHKWPDNDEDAWLIYDDSASI